MGSGSSRGAHPLRVVNQWFGARSFEENQGGAVVPPVQFAAIRNATRTRSAVTAVGGPHQRMQLAVSSRKTLRAGPPGRPRGDHRAAARPRTGSRSIGTRRSATRPAALVPRPVPPEPVAVDQVPRRPHLEVLHDPLELEPLRQFPLSIVLAAWAARCRPTAPARSGRVRPDRGWK